VLVCDTDGQIELANTVLAGIIGRPLSEIIGTDLRDLFLPDQQIPWETWRQESPDPMRQPAVLRMHGPDGRSLTVECHGRAIQLPLTGQEDTDDLARIHLVIQDVTTEHRRLHELQLLLDLTHLVSVQENIDAAFQIVAQRLVRDLGYRIAGIALVSPDRTHFEGHGYHRYIQDFSLNRLTTDLGITGRVFRENRSIMAPGVRRNRDYLEFDPEVRSELAVIIRSDGKPVGVIDIQSDGMHPLSRDDLALAENIAVHLGSLLDRLQPLGSLEPVEQRAQVDGIREPAAPHGTPGFPGR
jgi:putative methionine-R-sulfoxide reductase with GAF domain